MEAQAVHPLYLPRTATIEDMNKPTALETWFRFRFDDGRPLGHEPGQFAMVSVFGVGEAPISVSSGPTAEPWIEMVVRRTGSVTDALHKLNPGDKIGLRGPYGHGFPFEELRGHPLLFVGGGIGMVPLRSLVQPVMATADRYPSVTLLYGAKKPEELMFQDELEAWSKKPNVDVRITVDVGSEGYSGPVGLITTLIPPLTIDVAKTLVFVCGPPIMYRFVLMELEKKSIPHKNIYLSLERRMKCGVGKCGHCMINDRFCCLDGPVFRYDEIEGAPEAFS
jgi:sulfhydrogenase subunit gamma (sulfur reductase)